MPNALSIAPPKSLVQACHRLNPAVDLEVDVLAVVRADGASTFADWMLGTRTGVAVDPDSGAVTLAEAGSRVLFTSGGTAAGATTWYHPYNDANSRITERLWLDFWPDPGVVGPSGFTLHSLDVMVGRKSNGIVFGNVPAQNTPTGAMVVDVARLDANWNREALADQIVVPVTLLPMNGGTYSIDFRASGRTIRVATGQLRTRTGSGMDVSGVERTQDFTLEGDRKVSHLTVPMGISIELHPEGANPGGFFVGMLPSGTATPFDPDTFWRVSSGARDCGPYSPDVAGLSPLDQHHNPAYGTLDTGAVPGFGAKVTTAVDGLSRPYGQWGQSRQVNKTDKPQTAGEPGWNQAYHVLRAVTYGTSGTIVRTFDLGATPTQEVHFRADAANPTGTGIGYTVRGRQLLTDAWTSLGTVLDGQVWAAGTGYRYYELTATLTASADTLATPVLQDAFFTERTRYGTFRYTDEVDSATRVDPVSGTAEIGELALRLHKPGADNVNDLATTIATGYAPSNLEAWVYARETVTGGRHFLNLYRLENRDPDEGSEKFTFLSGMDRLKVVVPPKRTTYTFPADGTAAAITARSYTSATRVLVLTVGGTPFTSVNIVGMRVEGVTGVLGGTNWYVASSPAPTSNTFAIVLEDDAQVPTVGDTFKLHSDQTTRQEVVYSGQDFAAIFEDVRDSQAAVPQRYQGALPATTGRTGTGRLPADGRVALEVLQELALHCGGALSWIKGRISFVDIYGPKSVRERWSEADLVDVKPTVGADRRMPSLVVKYGYDFTANAFSHEVTFDDQDALLGWGRANLFDVASLPDTLCQWNDYAEARYLAAMLVGACATGVRLWPVKVVTPRPWLEIGDAVSLSTDIYTDRRLRFTAGGLTDDGTPIKGRLSVVGVIVGKNLWGTEFWLFVRGLSAITAEAPSTGTVTPAAPPPAAPTAASNTSVASSPPATVTNSVTPASSVNKVRVYKSGGLFGADLGPFTSGTPHALTHASDSGETATWEYAHVDATSGVESDKTTAFTTTVPPLTCPVPLTVAGSRSGSSVNITWSASTSNPAAAMYEVELTPTGAGTWAPAADSPTSGLGVLEAVGATHQDVRVRTTATGWSPSAWVTLTNI